jgi:membrane protease subunit HflC
MIFFTVRQGETAVVTTFGRPERAITEPGLYRRWPWPVQKVHTYDQRIQCLDGAGEQTLTQDGKSVIVTVFAGWRIADPVLFLERVGTVEEAERNLNGLISNYKNAVIGQYAFSSLLNVDPEKLKFAEIESRILEAVQPEAVKRYGVTVDFVGIRRINLPEAITEKVFERMRAERDEIAERYRSEGEGEAIRIRAEADSRKDEILAEAEAQAKRIRAEGDAAAAQYYETFEQDPELAMFLRKLEVLEETLKEKATVVLGPDTQPYDLLQGEEALPEAARSKR